MKYAFLGYESAVDANWALSRLSGFTPLDDEGIWLIPPEERCVSHQRDLKALMRETSLDEYGVRRRPVHLLVPSAASRSSGALMYPHVWTGFLPPHAFIRIEPQVFVSSPLFTILQLALSRRPSRLSHARAQQSFEEDQRIRRSLGITNSAPTAKELICWEGIAHVVRAAQVLSDFAGSYRLPTAPGEAVLYGEKPLLTCSSLETYLQGQPSMYGSEKVRRITNLAFDRAASPFETVLALLLTLPVDMGGFGLPRPVLNQKIALAPGLRGLCSQDSMTIDLCWEEKRLALEYEGWEAHAGLGRQKLAHDRARANSLTALRWRVLSVGYENVSSVRGITLLARQIAHLLGCDLVEPSELQLVWRTRLHAMLMPRRSG